MACGIQPEGFNWLKPLNIFQADEIPLKKVKLMEAVDASKYSLMDSEILLTPYALNSLAIVRETNIEVESPFY